MTYRSIRARQAATEAEQEAAMLLALNDAKRTIELKRPFSEQDAALQRQLDDERQHLRILKGEPA